MRFVCERLEGARTQSCDRATSSSTSHSWVCLFITLSLVRCGFHGSDGLYVGINGTVSDLSGLLYPGTHGDVLIEVWL